MLETNAAVSKGDEPDSPQAVMTESSQAESVKPAQINKEFPHFRWRLAGGKLPLYERHLRSLPRYGVSAPLQAWIRSRLEWTIENMTSEHPNGVLCIQVEDEDRVTVTVAPAREAPKAGCELEALKEYGNVWFVSDGALTPYEEPRTATDTLVRDLAKTLGYLVLETVQTESASSACCATVCYENPGDELFLVSDEFGVVPQGNVIGPITQRMVECFDKLWTVEE